MRFHHFEFDPATDKLGEGPQSEVYRATDSRLGRTVALKILRPHVEFDPAAKERFEREAKHTSNLAHPNIATIFDYGQDRGTSYIVMEYLEGRTLDRILKERPLGYEEGLRIALQVTSALSLVHQRGLIHRDLKPANIMVMPDGAVKLLDFGICRSTGESSITQDGMLVGTVLYMSPEQVLGDDLSVATDVFAFGSVFYHAFTGELPFPGRSFPEVCMAILESKPKRPAELRSGFPEPLSAFLMRCLSRDPKERFHDGSEAHGALLAVADGLRIQSTNQHQAAIRGRVLLPPFTIGDGVKEDFAGAVRKDLSSELSRSTELQISLVDREEAPLDATTFFVVRGALDLAGTDATLDYTLEHVNVNGNGHGSGKRQEILCERIHHSDADEWSLQGKLVGSLARSVRKSIAEVALALDAPARRDREMAERLTRYAHEVLHRGTSRHLMAAIASFRRAAEEDTTYALAHAGMAEALVRKFLYWDGDRSFLREAREEAQVALALDDQCAEAHTSLGFAFALTGNTAEAEREYNVAIQIDHDEWLAHRLLGALLARLGNFKDASPLLRRAIALQPNHIASYDPLYNVLNRLDSYQEAIQIADRGIQTARKHLVLVPDDQGARIHLALLLTRMGLADEARAEIKEARALAPRDAYTWFHTGCVEAVLGDADAALKALREAQIRGYYLQSELLRNPDFDLLRGRQEFQQLLG
jgi:tetratricopeptide (TPR) repeat protein/predicted Ser/Thr protein kinase